MRTAFVKELIEQGKKNDKIFLLVADLGFSVVEPFAELFPERFLNVGIAEQNMAGIATGLAMEGYNVYIYSIGNFPTLRCMEQIRYDICYHNVSVKIIAVGGGYAYASLGASHHATEEIGMLRTIPNLTVCAPGDPDEMRAITRFSSTYAGPCYIRIGKAGEPEVHKKYSKIVEQIKPGDILNVIDGSDVAVFSSGAMLEYSATYISQNKLKASLYSFPFVKPIDLSQLLSLFKKYKKIITIEEHQAHCGFGSAILELMNDLKENGQLDQAPAVKRIAINNAFYSKSGTQNYLRTIAGLEFKLSDFES
ncbi:MAG: transketolase C-terminal domain-containing protein [Verrucomicrobiota bacterium]|nr:transketolase C-terminal domain-containing protein [Verrucomicrobiota bacterium]